MSDHAERIYEGLTHKQRAFVDAYVGKAHGNATEAARLADYSEKTAYSIGCENLRKPEVREAIKERLRELTIGPEDILYRLTLQATANILDVLTPEGTLPESLAHLTRDQAASIKKFRVRKTKDTTDVSIELHDSQTALLALAKRWGLLPELLRMRREMEPQAPEPFAIITPELRMAPPWAYPMPMACLPAAEPDPEDEEGTP